MDFPIRVYYEDTDAGGVVYHTCYLHFFERARTEFLRQLGFSQQLLLSQSMAFVVKKMEIDYKKPAYLDDFLTVKSIISELKGAKIVFKQTLWRGEECLCEVSVVVVSVDLSKMKAIAIPEDIKQAFNAIISM
ncbi:tol-pal system-associated acyl-CoA thioesterase [Glaesserella parasuis]|uniref:tol-pal system-associated acyl-CoA thioesterase n=1 Tax=Glaesserella parasuis TaxID=738 RepID=UPI0013667946|nr:tol-pal system-associated acyl-CoA thioesterase [Glaesserella parasuis]MDG6241154.1 tol-pal system-associated acyl-CoA thioesterase [Glaesserella parasuis]MDG6294120.1 tol-pal system-associated acyl-CoA thioesterase [Glaesserella parasuis]MDG6792725.1 tol-pal system-associated acyl-CoA thioesterase [Glaesserella parasuis]MDG6853466.1 tol-pal system-associated acyl-CoA thioesterase [Glaesserella parasuis]MDG6855473.1 tol-pal system-associated acyl-CoA thioesterase [Glaesserella parasuis]